MIRNLLIVTVVGFIGSLVCLVGAAVVGVGDGSKGFYSREERSEDGALRKKVSISVSTRPKSSRDFAWNGGDTLVVNLPGEVEYTQGPAAKVTITAPQAVLDRVKVENGEIGVTGRRFDFKNRHIKIIVQAPNVNSFRFNGSQDVDIKNYAQDSLAIEANGAIDLEATGAARTINLRMNGAGDADLEDIVNEDAKVELNGAAKATLSPRKSVDVRINGVGHLTLARRPPVIRKETHGIGSVTVVEDDGDEPAPSSPTAPPPPPAPKAPKASATAA